MTEAIPMLLTAAAGAALGALIGPAAIIVVPATIVISTIVAQVICDAVDGGDA